MDNSPKLGFPYLTGEAQAETLHNEFIQMVQAILQGVEDKDLSAPPGSPADGDSYIVGAGPTGLWSGRADSLAIYDGLAAAWIFVPGEDDAGTPIAMGAAQKGLRVYVKDENLSRVWDGAAWAVKEAYDIPGGFAAEPSISTPFTRVPIVRGVFFDADFAGSGGVVTTAPAAAYAIDVQDDSVSIGTISVSTGGAVTFTTAGGTAKTVAAGSILDFVSPGALDGTIAGLSAVLKGRIA